MSDYGMELTGNLTSSLAGTLIDSLINHLEAAFRVLQCSVREGIDVEDVALNMLWRACRMSERSSLYTQEDSGFDSEYCRWNSP